MATDTKLIVNLTRGTELCEGVLADRLLPRMRGLLGRSSLPEGEGLLIRPAPSIHTAFMRFPIDALFLDADLTVLGIEVGLRPWRIAARRRARAVLELAAGESDRLGVRVGDRLSVRERERDHEPERVLPVERRELLSLDPEPLTLWAPDLHAQEHVDAARVRPLSVLVVSADRRFRSVASVLIARRGCAVATTDDAARLVELAGRVRADVVVIDVDGSRASAQARATALELSRGVGVVVVEEEPDQDAGGGPEALAKWGPFEHLFAAIETAGIDRSSGGGDDGRA